MSYFGNGWQTENQFAAQALMETAPFKGHVDLIVTQSGADVQKQNAQLNQLIAEGVNAIVLFAISADGLNTTIQAACDAGIVVVTYSGAVTAPCAHNVTVNDTLFGTVTAEWLVAAMGGKGNILMNHGVAGSPPATLRNTGARAVFAKYPDIHIVAEENGDWDSAVSQTAAAKALAAHPDINGVYSEAGSDGVVRAMEAQGLPLVPTTGEGTNGWHLMLLDPALAAKGLTGMSTSQPGYDSVVALKFAVAALEGKDVPKDYYIPLPVVYQKIPATLEPGIDAAALKECTDITAGCNVFPAGMFPADYFDYFYFKGLPQMTLNMYVTGKP
jgi:ribose transport system substrate-binding protein